MIFTLMTEGRRKRGVGRGRNRAMPCGLRSGFTLLEIMVALSIMAVALVAVYRLYSQTVSMNALLRFNTNAPLLAQMKFNDVLNMPAEDLMDDSGDFAGEAFQGYTWQTTITPIESEILGNVADDLKKIDLTVASEKDRLVYHLSLYRFSRQE